MHRILIVAFILAALAASLQTMRLSKETLSHARTKQQVAEAAHKASEQARTKEHELQQKVERLDHDLQAEKRRNADLSRAHAVRVREYQAAIDSAAAANPSAPCGASSPFAAIAGECGRALTALDAYARELETTAGALQEYAQRVCVGK